MPMIALSIKRVLQAYGLGRRNEASTFSIFVATSKSVRHRWDSTYVLHRFSSRSERQKEKRTSVISVPGYIEFPTLTGFTLMRWHWLADAQPNLYIVLGFPMETDPEIFSPAMTSQGFVERFELPVSTMSVDSSRSARDMRRLTIFLVWHGERY
ncbi:hypothetical protein CIRG_06322 [Coccidioides immitis RMSCC 2394]|uniref:Uncharacterized protein n=1 Tax=Coccidioides immitis RMSCC 2394 TaxID=404692 RepID=A0A0J6YD61_COCIT|nr:hypothetical protein CIRG_06322 [Coccidioides immitis RMSCC 2394]